MINAESTDESLVPSATRTTNAGLLAVAAVAVLLIVVPGSAEAGTTVNSDITSNTTWDAAGSPYTVSTIVTVADTDAPVLTIEEGVEVRFESGTRLQIGTSSEPGVLRANGTTRSPITFTSAVSAPAPGDYEGLRFSPVSAPTSFLQNATLEYAGGSGVAALLIDDYDVEVATLNVSRSGHDAVYVEDANPPLTNLSLWNNGDDGIELRRSSPTIADTTIEDSSNYGIHAQGASSNPALETVHVQESSKYPLRVRVDTDLSTTTMGPEGDERIELWGTTLSTDRTLPLPTDVDDGNEFVVSIISDLTVAGGATFTIQPGTRLEMGSNDRLQFGTCCSGSGSLDAQGTAAEPITLTAADPSREWGQLKPVDGDASAPFVLRNATVEHFSRVYADGHSDVTLDNVTVEHANNNGLRSWDSTLSVRNVAINDTEGVKMRGGSTATLDTVTVENVTKGDGVSLSSASVTWNEGRITNTPNKGVWINSCPDSTFRNLTIEHTGDYGIFADDACGWAHLHDVRINDTGRRAWRNNIGAAYDNVTLSNIGVTQLDYWGATFTSDFTFPKYTTPGGDRYGARLLTTVNVENGATLTLPAGLTVAMDGNFRIGSCCNGPGSFEAQGTASDPIVLRSLGSGYAGKIRATDAGSTSTFVLRNVTYKEPGEAVQIEDYSNAVVDNTTIQDTQFRALDTQWTTLAAKNLEVSNSWGIRIKGGSTTFQNVTATNIDQDGIELNNGGTLTWDEGGTDTTVDNGVFLTGCAQATLSNVTLNHTGNYGLFANDACSNADLHDVVINDTARRPWRNPLDATYDNVTLSNIGWNSLDYWGATFTRDFTFPQRTTPSGDLYTPRVLSTIYVENGATLAIQPGTSLRMDARIVLGASGPSPGSLDAQGTTEDPITFHAIGSFWPSISGDFATASTTFKLRNTTLHDLGESVQIEDYPNAVIDNTTIQDTQFRSLDIVRTSLAAKNLEVSNSWGVRITGGSTTFDNVTVTDTDLDGIELKDSDGAVLTGLNVSGAAAGVHLVGSNDAVIRNSTFRSNDVGVQVDADANRALVYNNVFNNTQNVDDSASDTRWNVTPTELTDDTNILGGHWLGGNFFHDYTGEDTDHDGLGDTQTPYTKGISGTGDEHPLVRVGPIDLEAVPGAQAGSIELAWAASIPPAETYHIERATTSGGPYTEVATTSDVTYTDTGLEDDQRYYYVVIAEFSDGSTNATNEASSEPRPPAPESPSAAPGAETGTIDLDWDPPSGTSTAFTYHVKRGTASGGPYTEISTTTDTTFNDTDLSPGTYYYVVTAEDDGVESPLSTEVSAQPAQPDPPVAVRVTAAGQANALQLDWQPPADESSPLTYHVKRATSSEGPYTEVATTTDLDHTDAGLGDRTYYYVVFAETDGGLTSVDSQVDGAHPRPSAPLDVQAQQGLEAGSIQVDWDPPSEASGSLTYHVYRSTKDGGPYERIAQNDATRYTDTGLAEGTYHYVVTAVDDAGLESPTSTQASAPSGGPTDVPSDTDEAQNDAGTGGDASDDPDDPTILAGGELIRINGTLIPGNDTIDAYGTNISPNATISMSFNFTSPATMELEAFLIAPDGQIEDRDQAPTEGGPVEVEAVADEREHLQEGTWVTVLRHGTAGLAPSVGPALSLGPEGPAAAPASSPLDTQPTAIETGAPTPDDGTVPDVVPDRFTFVDYRDERPCDPHC